MPEDQMNTGYRHCRRSIILALLLFGSAQALAQETTELDKQIVESAETPAESERADLRQRLDQVPGGTNLINITTLRGSLSSLAKVLKMEPGIIVQEFFGGNDQPRINIRGSGIQDNPVSRGIQILHDGLATNQADGSFIIGLSDPGQTKFITTYRGANATRYGATTLGGAVNFHPRTALNSPELQLSAEAGSFNFKKLSLSGGQYNNSRDFYVRAEQSMSDGWRSHSKANRQTLALNSGWQSAILQNRTYLNIAQNDFDIPFMLSKERSKKDPSSVMGDYNTAFDRFMDVNKRDPYRKTRQLRLANKSSVTSSAGTFSLGAYAEKIDDKFRNPAIVMDTYENNFGLDLSFSDDFYWFSRHPTEVRLFSYFNYGNMPRKYTSIHPDNGQNLQVFADLDQHASNSVAGAEIIQHINDRFKFITAIQAVINQRDIDDRLQGILDSRFKYQAINPKIGAIYKIQSETLIFANISRSSEAPTFWQLATSSPNPNDPLNAYILIRDLRLQTANTAEVGIRSSREGLNWEFSSYYSRVNNELISEVQDFAIDGTTVNYTHGTVHRGAEAAIRQTTSSFGPVDFSQWYLSYNWSDFRFMDGRYKGNRIAGIPQHQLAAEVIFNIDQNFSVSLDWRAQPQSTFVDHSNSGLKQDAYQLFGSKLQYQSSAGIKLFVEANNIANQIYQSAYVVRGYSPDDPDVPAFIPGPPRNYMLGVSYEW